MSSSIKVRLCAIASLITFPYVWFWITSGLWGYYVKLLNQAPEVKLSLITLWLPVGMLGFLILVFIAAPIAIYTGRKLEDNVPPKTTDILNKIVKYFAILGIFTAIAFSWHCFNLLDEYGYQYSSKLSKFSATGIHLVYTKP